MSDLDTNSADSTPDDFIFYFVKEVIDFKLFEENLNHAIKQEISRAVKERLRSNQGYDFSSINWESAGEFLGVSPEVVAKQTMDKIESEIAKEVIKNTEFDKIMKEEAKPQLSETRTGNKKWVLLMD